MLHLLLLEKQRALLLRECHIICLGLFVLSIMQLQNSRTVILERDRVIRDLEEKVSFLEAEVRNLIQLQLESE